MGVVRRSYGRRPAPFALHGPASPRIIVACILRIYCVLAPFSSFVPARMRPHLGGGGVPLSTLDNSGSNAMSNFRQQLFHQFASQGLATSIDAFKTQYQPKKENRFNIDGITYEIGPARLNGDTITFEI